MGCDSSAINGDVKLDCADIPVGGIVEVYVARFSDAVGKLTETDGVVTASSIPAGKIVNLEFNNKDGYSSFTDTKTIDDSGVVKAIPNVMLEFPKMTLKKRNALEKFSTPNTEYVLFVKTAGDVKHAIGMDDGCWASEVNGQSGEGKDSKNMYNLKFEGEEINLARTVSDAAWNQIVASLKPIA